MKPSVQKIITKLAKEQIKVDLNVVKDIARKTKELAQEGDDLDKVANKINKLGVQVRNLKEDLDAAMQDGKEALNSAKGEIQVSKKIFNNAKKSAEDLGVDYKQIKGLDFFQSAIEVLEEDMDNLRIAMQQNK